MNHQISSITKRINAPEPVMLLRAWQWLVEVNPSLLMVSLFGDLFLQYPDQTVHWLDTGAGELTQIAESSEEFEALLQLPENASYWLMPNLVDELKRTGRGLQQNEVYSFKQLPVLGGDYTIENLEPNDLLTHLDFSGVVNEQLRKLPDGTNVIIQSGP